MVATVLQGIIMGLMIPSSQAILREIINKEQLMNALRLQVPVVTGLLIDIFDFKAIYYAITGMYLLAVAFIVFMSLTSTTTTSSGSVVAGIKEGLQYIRRETTILLVIVFTLFAVVPSMPYVILMPFSLKTS